MWLLNNHTWAHWKSISVVQLNFCWRCYVASPTSLTRLSGSRATYFVCSTYSEFITCQSLAGKTTTLLESTLLHLGFNCLSWQINKISTRFVEESFFPQGYTPTRSPLAKHSIPVLELCNVVARPSSLCLQSSILGCSKQDLKKWNWSK